MPIHVEWNYKADTDGAATDRVLVVLPPIPSLVVPYISRQTDIAHHYRKTLTNLCSNESLKYILVYVPEFDPTSYDQRCLFEDFYGKELRLISHLEKLLERTFPDYLTSECVYMLKDPDDWRASRTPLEWYFDRIICDQLYEYYDPTSRWLRRELPKFIDGNAGASQIYETVLLKLVLTNDEMDKDLVCVFGDLEPYEMEPYMELLKRLIDDQRISALYSFGNFSASLQTLRSATTTVPKFELYTTPVLSTALYTQTLQSIVKYSPTYNTYLWLGAFQWESPTNTDTQTHKHLVTKLHSKAFVYSPTAWCSLYPERVFVADAPDAPLLTYEPLGVLEFFTDTG